MTRFHVKVTPGAKTFSIVMEGSYPRITLTQPAEQGRANAELVRRLSRILDTKVRIVSGHRKGRKELAADLPEDEIMRKLEDL